MAVTLWVPFNDDLNADISLASPVGNDNGTGTTINAAVKKFGAASVDCDENDNRYAIYEGNANIPNQKGSIGFWIRTGYDGQPSHHQQIVGGNKGGYLGADWKNTIQVQHITDGTLYIYFKDQNNDSITNPGSAWSSTLGQWYYFELNWDFTLAHGSRYVMLHIDGVNFFNPTITLDPLVRGAMADWCVGTITSGYDPQVQRFHLDEMLVYDEPLHTTSASFTPPIHEYGSAPPPSGFRRVHKTKGIYSGKIRHGGIV